MYFRPGEQCGTGAVRWLLARCASWPARRSACLGSELRRSPAPSPKKSSTCEEKVEVFGRRWVTDFLLVIHLVDSAENPFQIFPTSQV